MFDCSQTNFAVGSLMQTVLIASRLLLTHFWVLHVQPLNQEMSLLHLSFFTILSNASVAQYAQNRFLFLPSAIDPKNHSSSLNAVTEPTKGSINSSLAIPIWLSHCF
jgi:hypothetical protein